MEASNRRTSGTTERAPASTVNTVGATSATDRFTSRLPIIATRGEADERKVGEANDEESWPSCVNVSFPVTVWISVDVCCVEVVTSPELVALAPLRTVRSVASGNATSGTRRSR